MKGKEYNEYLHAIKAANEISDKDKCKKVLSELKLRLLVDYGMQDDDVPRLIKYFRFNVQEILGAWWTRYKN